MVQSILFVCLGNICRSPSAEGVLRAMAEARGLALEIDSAGTDAFHVGEQPYPPMQRVARTRGYDLSGQRARRFTPDDFDRFDLILAKDEANFAHLERARPENSRAGLGLFMDYAPGAGTHEVPDPYYTRDFEGTLDLIEAAAEGLLAQLAE